MKRGGKKKQKGRKALNDAERGERGRGRPRSTFLIITQTTEQEKKKSQDRVDRQIKKHSTKKKKEGLM